MLQEELEVQHANDCDPGDTGILTDQGLTVPFKELVIITQIFPEMVHILKALPPSNNITLRTTDGRMSYCALLVYVSLIG